MQIFDYTFNSIGLKACFVTSEQRRPTRNDTFSLVLTKDSKNKEKNLKSLFEGRTTLNPSAFGATPYSAGKK